jgi:hypothetical protein
MTELQKKAALEQIRLMSTREVTETSRECDCLWCSSGPRRPIDLMRSEL